MKNNRFDDERMEGFSSDPAFRDLLRMGTTDMPFSGFEDDVMQRIEMEEALLEQKPAILLRLSSLLFLMVGVITGFMLASYVGGIENLYIFTGEQLSRTLQFVVVLLMLLQLERIFTVMHGRRFRMITEVLRR